MATGVVIAIVVGVVIVLAIGAFLLRQELRRRELRARFGPEYDRMLQDTSGRKAAEHELAERERRHAELDLRPLPATSRERYTQSWGLIQARFVDRPGAAVEEADRMVVTIMEERGYPAGNYEQRLSMLSVEHAGVLGHYREANDVRVRHERSQVSTEELRTAMVHYRTLIEDLLEPAPAAGPVPAPRQEMNKPAWMNRLTDRHARQEEADRSGPAGAAGNGHRDAGNGHRDAGNGHRPAESDNRDRSLAEDGAHPEGRAGDRPAVGGEGRRTPSAGPRPDGPVSGPAEDGGTSARGSAGGRSA